jgi:hypothetical protein
MTTARAAHLAGIIPAIRRALDAAEEAVRAHVHAAGAPLVLANGQEYAPAVEEVRHYKTAETFEALAARVGDARANDAFVATPDRLRAALRGDADRLPRGAWAAFEKELEARGAVVVGAREVWRRRWPAKPVEVGDGEEQGTAAEAPRASTGAEQEGASQGPEAANVAPACVGEVPAAGAEVPPHVPGVRREAQGARAPCSVCGVDVAVNRASGMVRAHLAPGTKLKCDGSRMAPRRSASPPPEQLQITGA